MRTSLLTVAALLALSATPTAAEEMRLQSWSEDGYFYAFNSGPEDITVTGAIVNYRADCGLSLVSVGALPVLADELVLNQPKFTPFPKDTLRLRPGDGVQVYYASAKCLRAGSAIVALSVVAGPMIFEWTLDELPPR